MTPATEACLQQVQDLRRRIERQSRELDRKAQATLAAIGELEQALKSHDAYAVAVALDAVEDLTVQKEFTMPNDGANRRNQLLEKARNQLRAFKETVRELAALSNPTQIAELIQELQDQMKAL
jgi:hypothetical protein